MLVYSFRPAKLIFIISQSLEDATSHSENSSEDLATGKLAGCKETMLHAILTSSLPPVEKSLGGVIDEAFVLLASGTDTTPHVLTNATYNVLTNPGILSTLKRELEAPIPELSTP